MFTLTNIMHAEVFSQVFSTSFFEVPGLGQVSGSSQVPCKNPPCANGKKIV